MPVLQPAYIRRAAAAALRIDFSRSIQDRIAFPAPPRARRALSGPPATSNVCSVSILAFYAFVYIPDSPWRLAASRFGL
jgi:hypothetical protein